MDYGIVSHKQSSHHNLGSTEPRNYEEISNGSANLKHQRSGFAEDNWRLPKMPKPGEVDFDFSNKKSFVGRSNLWPSSSGDDVDVGQKMLSFSSSDQAHCNGGISGGGGSTRSIAFSICQDEHLRKIGGGLSEGIRGSFARLKGPFTPSQWMELEHQALIYKHIVSNVPVPSNLLVPIKRSLYSYGSYAPNFLGWGPFHLGFSGSNDPEPGRCRRTDGKKWRCSRDAVPDQKYCERHINRGRHRSRKPVEGQTGHAANSNTTTNTTTSSKVPPIASSSKASNSVGGSIQHQQFNPLQHPNNTANASTNLNRTQGFQGLSLIQPPTTNPKPPKDVPPFSSINQKQQQHVQFGELSHSEFGFVSSDSLLNPTQRISYMNTTNPNPVHHFIDDWPKNQPDRSSGPTWPEEQHLKPDWTQLSMSIADFSSSSSSPQQEKSTLSTLRLSDELDPIHMSLGMGHDHLSWGNSMGGPLGEVLTITTSGSSPQLGSSPTGVLQKTSFVTLSNSSSVSSPTSAENKKIPENGTSLCNGVFGSALLSSGAL